MISRGEAARTAYGLVFATLNHDDAAKLTLLRPYLDSSPDLAMIVGQLTALISAAIQTSEETEIPMTRTLFEQLAIETANDDD